MAFVIRSGGHRRVVARQGRKIHGGTQTEKTVFFNRIRFADVPRSWPEIHVYIEYRVPKGSDRIGSTLNRTTDIISRNRWYGEFADNAWWKKYKNFLDTEKKDPLPQTLEEWQIFCFSIVDLDERVGLDSCIIDKSEWFIVHIRSGWKKLHKRREALKYKEEEMDSFNVFSEDSKTAKIVVILHKNGAWN